MTIILTLGNRDQVIQFSDRRLSDNGSVVDDESNKAGVLLCLDARLAFGYTGLARVGQFKTHEWLLQSLHEAGPPDFRIGGILERLRRIASATFTSHPALKGLRSDQKRLSMMFSGYVYFDGHPRQGCAILSNYLDWLNGVYFDCAQEEFTAKCFTEETALPDVNPTMIKLVGNWSGFDEAARCEFRLLMMEKKPAHAIVDIAVDYLRQLADDPRSNNSIGKQLSSICIPPDTNRAVETAYHTHVKSWDYFQPDYIQLLPKNEFLVSDLRFEILDRADSPPLLVPKVSRNAPCPCGSKIRYKNCHGRRRG